jgi:hypothetical protein
VAPLEPWEKVLVNAEAFPQTVLGKLACADCHGGREVADKDVAHEGLIRRPSEEPQEFCQDCHDQETESHANNLHSNQQGYWTALEAHGSSLPHVSHRPQSNGASLCLRAAAPRPGGS